MKALTIIGAVLVMCILCVPCAHAKNYDIIRINEDADIAERMVVDDVVVIGGNITVSGRVEKNIVAVGGSVTLKPKAYVGGDVVIVGGKINKEESSIIGGHITQIYMPPSIPSFTTFVKEKWIAFWATISFLALIGFLGLAVLFMLIIPEHLGNAVSALEISFTSMFLWGILWMIFVVPITVLLAISIIGVILIPLEILLLVLALILGYITSAIFIGKNIFLVFKKTPPPFIDAILGILILFVVGFIPVAGTIVKVVLLIAGFGAILKTRFGTTIT